MSDRSVFMASNREKLKRKRRKREGAMTEEGEEEEYRPKSVRLANSISER